jgi:hypothetical protein
MAERRPVIRLAIVMGGASCLSQDLVYVRPIVQRIPDAVIVVVNDAGAHYPGPIDHWCTLHGEKMAMWMEKRGEDRSYETWSTSTRSIIKNQYKGRTGGSSGLYAASVAQDKLCARGTILCGIPMDGTLNRFTNKEWRDHSRYVKAWHDAADELRVGVRSMSGLTRKILGYPDDDWVTGLL